MSNAYKCDVCLQLKDEYPDTEFYWEYAPTKKVGVFIALNGNLGRYGDICQACVDKALDIVSSVRNTTHG